MANQRINKRTSRRSSKTKVLTFFDVRFFNILLAILGTLFFVGYLVMNNQATTRGFSIRTLESAITELENEQRRLDIEAVSMRSMKRVEERVSQLGMVEVTVVDYISTTSPSVAIK